MTESPTMTSYPFPPGRDPFPPGGDPPEVAALCVAPRSVYKAIPGVIPYCKRRDARSFPGDMPIVAHPPCGPWSWFTSHQSAAGEEERALGLFCADMLRRCGGVLEQPAWSRLFYAAGLPRPGERIGDLYGIEVRQSAWGHPVRKLTWLAVAGVDPARLVIPADSHDSRAGVGDARRLQLMSREQRSATPPLFAAWLVALARSVDREALGAHPRGGMSS